TAVGGAAAGGCAVGGFAVGGMACGAVTNGGFTVGLYVKGPAGFAKHRMSGTARDPEALQIFRRFEWLLGSATAPFSFFIVYWILIGGLGVFVICSILLLIGLLASKQAEPHAS
ncbi:MAG: hypothetical protein JNG88_18280, partial [Phycisphaerales bacterium]|nr:hypothetical protein [Phycisphaerales bacterium]